MPVRLKGEELIRSGFNANDILSFGITGIAEGHFVAGHRIMRNIVSE